MMHAQGDIKLATIEVSGSHEITFAPESVDFEIDIQEYWKEEFEGKKWKDYKNKIDIVTIENNLINELKDQDISMDQITLQSAGNYYRHRGKDFLVHKKIKVKLPSVAQANELTSILKTRGIQSMNVTGMNHSKNEEYLLEVKKNAVLNAKKKAVALASAVGKKVVDVISIIDQEQNGGYVPVARGYARAEAAMMDGRQAPVSYDNYREMKLSSSVRVVFVMD